MDTIVSLVFGVLDWLISSGVGRWTITLAFIVGAAILTGYVAIWVSRHINDKLARDVAYGCAEVLFFLVPVLAINLGGWWWLGLPVMAIFVGAWIKIDQRDGVDSVRWRVLRGLGGYKP